MKPQTYLRASRTAWFSRLTLDSPHGFSVMEASGFVEKALRPLIALSIVLLLLTLGHTTLFAQQPGWPGSNPYGAQYAPSQQAPYGQPGYAQPQPYAQQPYPASGQAYPQDDAGLAQPPAQPLNAGQLEQLVAPIALYPDALVAQVLAAATYPSQVAGADHWRQAMGYASPGQIVDGADAQPWDPSVKALTAFPQVLALMDRNLQWTTDLGNAYYNQPQDVLEIVQVLRQRAQQAGTLRNTPQEMVSYNQGYIELAPPNSQVVYVPAYNPWDVYGQPVSPYHGFSLLGALESMAGSSLTGSSPINYGLGMAMSAFGHTNWGWLEWGLNWLSHSVLFNHSNYSSQSNSVAQWSAPYGGRRALPERAAIPRGYPAQGSYGRPSNGYDPPGQRFNRPMPEAYNRVPPPVNRPQPYAVRPGYGSGFAGRPGENYGNRPGAYYGAPMQSYRAAAPGSQRGDPGQRFSAPSPGRDYPKFSGKQEHSGGFHLFGGAHAPEKSYGRHAPKGFKNEHRSGGGHAGGGRHSGGHLFGFHFD